MASMKGVIIAAGYGTRFLPVTKTIPKEMLPLVTKPAIAFVMDEFAASGIRDVIIVTSRRKKALEDYFDREIELESVFSGEGKAEKAASVGASALRVSFVRQTEMRGTGHALLQAAPFIGDEPCVVAYPDDIHFGSPPLARQLMDVYGKSGCSVLASLRDPGDVSRYGVIDPAPDGLHVRGFIEKPAKGKEPSHEVSIGRYLYTPDFFKYLEEGWAKHSGGEYYHLGSLNRLIEAGKLAYLDFTGTRLDTGEPAGYVEAFLSCAWEDPVLRERISAFMRSRT
jgi:UTP--glucose-1-phosphate uridylyltransferase